MRVGLIGAGLFVECNTLSDDRETWHAPGYRGEPVLRVGTAYESYSRYCSFTLYDQLSGTPVIEIRVASTNDVPVPYLLADHKRLFVLTDGWIAEIDLDSKSVRWESLHWGPYMAAWLIKDHIIVVSEIEVYSLNNQGQQEWSHSIDLVTDYRRSPPYIHITDDNENQVVIHELTGTLTVER